MLHIVIDTREQTPWWWPEHMATTTRGTLQAGDYALAGDDGFAIERKSLPDFVGTVAGGWQRFQAELDRMEAARFAARVVVVEGDFHELWDTESHGHPQLHGAFLAKRVADLTMRGVCVLFAHDAAHAAGLAARLLHERQRHLETRDNG